jgi:L-asparagine transporter-like permease
LKLEIATLKLALLNAEWVPGQHGPSVAALAVWVSNTTPEILNILVMVAASGTMKSALATTVRAQFLAPTPRTLNGVRAQCLACLLIILLKFSTVSTALGTEFLELVLIVLLFNPTRRNATPLLSSVTECAL